jgi:hypothetical protein
MAKAKKSLIVSSNNIVAIHHTFIMTREYACHEPYKYDYYRAILSDLSVVNISQSDWEVLNAKGEIPSEKFVSDSIGNEGEWTEGVEIETFIASIRPCTCGSGEYWATCGANSPYCG